MIEYKIKEQSEDENKVVIEKSGQVYDFTVGQARENLADLKKSLVQFEGQKTIEDAKMTNILEHNPFIKDLTEAQVHAVHLYFESFAVSKVCNDKIKEHKEVIAEIEAELVEIKHQVGVTI